MTGYDVERLQGLLTWVDTPGVNFDYRRYVRRTACGTTMCLAGKVILDKGAEPVWNGWANKGEGETAITCRTGDTLIHISDLATRLCGLTYEEGELLFNAETGCQENDEQCARDFLNVLVGRAENGMPNMLDEEVEEWAHEWKLTNCPE